MFDDSFIRERAERHEIEHCDLLLPGLLFTEETLSQFRDLEIPERLQEPRYLDLSRLIGELLHPLFDIVWNAAGFRESLYFDSEGVWTGQLRRDLS